MPLDVQCKKYSVHFEHYTLNSKLLFVSNSSIFIIIIEYKLNDKTDLHLFIVL